MSAKNYKEAGHVSRQIKETERRQQEVRLFFAEAFRVTAVEKQSTPRAVRCTAVASGMRASMVRRLRTLWFISSHVVIKSWRVVQYFIFSCDLVVTCGIYRHVWFSLTCWSHLRVSYSYSSALVAFLYVRVDFTFTHAFRLHVWIAFLTRWHFSHHVGFHVWHHVLSPGVVFICTKCVANPHAVSIFACGLESSRVVCISTGDLHFRMRFFYIPTCDLHFHAWFTSPSGI